MPRFRQFLFWAHLATGLTCGTIIGLLCFTGTLLTYEKELTAYFERDARRVAMPATDTPRLPLDELQRRLREAHPEANPNNIVVARDPQVAVAFVSGRTGNYYVNPHTGEVRRPASEQAARFMQTMVTWHRYIGFSGEQSRPRGKLVTGIVNFAFAGLACTGLILWCPRSMSWRAFRPGIWFTQNATARARDWNWHNAIGFWCAPVLIVLTLTALPISFRWGAELTYLLTGTPLPATGPQYYSTPPPAATVPTPPPEAKPVPRDLLLDAVRREVPAWQTVTFRYAHQPDPTKPQPVNFTVRESDTLPRTATATLQFDPFTGTLLQRDGYNDLSAARKLRVWTRFLHTGEALGPWAQFLAGVASLGGCFLVYTGFALSWRRFFRNQQSPTATGAEPT